MECKQLCWMASTGWTVDKTDIDQSYDLILVFGSIDVVGVQARYDELRSFFPKADIVLSSTAGEIYGKKVLDGSIIATAIKLEKTKIKCVTVLCEQGANSDTYGQIIRDRLLAQDLCHIFVISDGIHVNGDELASGLRREMPENVVVTGGLAGDMGHFKSTLVGLNASPESNRLVAVGFYGQNFKISYGSKGGWDGFGPFRTITKSKGNVLFELDGLPALELYKKYLGPKAAELPSSALLFPLKIQSDLDAEHLVRTILSIDEVAGSMTFAGDIPQGSKVKFMMANFDHLIDGAESAANFSNSQNDFDPDLVIMISCVGRKLVLGDRVEEEVEAVVNSIGSKTTCTGFYSNGELSPLNNPSDCRLHNQTMTITAYAEV